MKKLALFCFIFGAILVTLSCSRERYMDPVDEDNAPGPVSNIQVERLPGGARLTYNLPEDPSLRYVKAEFYIRKDFRREAISSLYTNNLVVDGFPDTAEYEVKLYSVSRGEKLSQPVSIMVRPLPSPLLEAYKTLQFKETFGGVTVTFENSGEASLAVTILTDSAGKLTEVETYYTKAMEGRHSVRGFDPQPRIFGAVIRDRWGNLSDTVTSTITPIFEQLIPKDNFKALNLPTDTYEKHIPEGNIEQMWDGRIAPNGGIGVFHTKPGSGMPQWFSFDMGRIVQLSRYKLFHRGPGALWAYQLAAPKKWEVWGTADQPDPQGGWDGWTKLMDCDSYKPSGDGPVTNDDAVYATATGEDFTFPDNTPPVRYLRFKVLETWGYLDYIYIGELTFWGQPQ